MNYEAFKYQLLSDLQRELNPAVSLILQDIIKNNDTHLDGLTMLAADSNMAPTVYLNHYFPQYEDGRPLDEIREEILSICHANCPAAPIDVSFFTDYAQVRSRIVFKLVHYERNRALLADVPHYRYLDLAIVFHCLLHSETLGNATILIRQHHLSFWNITRDDLYALAMENTPRLLPYEFRSLNDLLVSLFDDPAPAVSDDSLALPLYVLTNRQKLNGAACILYQDLLAELAGRLDSDLYLLPSSIHEFLVLPAAEQLSRLELSGMVQDVNSSQVAREEILSDHIYYFSRETGRITM